MAPLDHQQLHPHRLTVLPWSLLVFFFVGCTHLPRDPLPYRLPAAPLSSLEPLASAWAFEVTATHHSDHHRTDSFTFRVYDDVLGRFRTAQGVVVIPESDSPVPLIAVAPILGGAGNDYQECRRFAEGAAWQGHASFWLLQDHQILQPSDSGMDVERRLRAWTVTMRQALDVLLEHYPIDDERLGFFGISLGALRGVPLLAVEPRLKRGVLCLGGSSLPRIVEDSAEGMVEDYREGRAERLGVEEEAVIEELVRYVRTEPEHFASAVHPHRVLMILARFDRHVPIEYGWDLYRLLGRPETRVTPLGHYTSIILWSWMVGHAMEFLGGPE